MSLPVTVVLEAAAVVGALSLRRLVLSLGEVETLGDGGAGGFHGAKDDELV